MVIELMCIPPHLIISVRVFLCCINSFIHNFFGPSSAKTKPKQYRNVRSTNFVLLFLYFSLFFFQMLRETDFILLENDPKIQFFLRTTNGRGIVYTMQKLNADAYRIMVRAKSYDDQRRVLEYQTTFVIHISVSAFPYY